MSRCLLAAVGIGLPRESRWSACGESGAAGSAGGACFLPRLSNPLVGWCLSYEIWDWWMSLQSDVGTEAVLAGFVADLKSARLAAGLTQTALASRLSVLGKAISEWETGAIVPTLGNLILWSCSLGRRLMILDQYGDVRSGPERQLPGESWEVVERRRLAGPLRNRRQALGMRQDELACRVGVSRDSIYRWELAYVPPRPIAHVVWAQKLGYSLALQPAIPQG